MVPRQSILCKGVPQYLALALALCHCKGKAVQGNGNIPERLLFAMSGMLV